MKPRLLRSDATAFDNLGFGALTHTISCIVKEELGVAPTLEMSLLNDDPNFVNVEVGNIIAVEPNKNDPIQAFVIEEISKPIDGIVTIYATHIAQHRTKLIPVAPFTATDLDTALSLMVSSSLESNPFTLVRDEGKNNVVATMHPTVPHSFRELMGGVEGSILDVYRGEWKYDNFTCTLYNKRGRDNGVRVMYGRNMSDFKLEEQFNWDGSATGVIGYWVNSEDGTTVIGDIQYSDYADLYPYKKTVCMDFSDKWESAPSVTDLNTYALSWINGKGLYGASVTVAFEHLNVEGGADIGLGDTVHIFNGTYNFEMESRIVGLEYDVLAEEYTSVTIGEQKTTLNEAIADIGGGSTSSGGGGSSVDPSTTLPIMDGTAAIGTEQTYARGDHVHPTDTSRAAKTDLTINNISPSDKWLIPNNTDFNTLKKIGTYYVATTAAMATMTNAPTGVAGTLTISMPLANVSVGAEVSGAWQYIIQEFTTWAGAKYRRECGTDGNGTWSYGQWNRVPFENETMVRSYGILRHNTNTDISVTSETNIATGTFTKQHNNTRLLCFIGGSFYCSTYTAALYGWIDNSAVCSIRTNIKEKGTSNSTVYVINNISAGTHNLRLTISPQAGATAYAPSYTEQYFAVVEI